MSYAAKVIADSLSPDGVRLTSIEATFPRFILAEVNTHRMLSRNSASSRAIPVVKRIEMILADPFVPESKTDAESLLSKVVAPVVGSFSCVGTDDAVRFIMWAYDEVAREIRNLSK